MNTYNQLLDYKDITTESGISEPVTLQEMKDYMRLEGFVDVDESTTDELSDFDYDDDLIESLITAARKKIENFCGVSVVFHTWKVLFTNLAGDFEFPWGPVRLSETDKITTLLDTNGTEIEEANYELLGFNFVMLKSPLAEELTATYDAGYTEVPEEIETAIKQMVYFWYINRGESNDRTIPQEALATLRGLRRAWTYVA